MPNSYEELIRDAASACNHTELYQLCRDKGLAVTPTMTYEQLTNAFLTGQTEPVTNQFDRWREGLTGFIFDHWKMLAPQLTCPIRSHDPKSCWTCLDGQVMTCVERNQKYLVQIRTYQKEPK